MIRRFLYHGFWNFYDYLGTYALLGMAHTAVGLGIFLILSWIPAVPVFARLTILGLMAIAIVLLAALGCAGFFPFAWKAAQDLPARLPDLAQGIRSYFRRYLLAMVLIALFAAVIFANIRFYFWIGNSYP